MAAAFGVSAQFGGRDAADAVLPLFRSLKAAMRAVPLTGFPFSKLAFILRVDGQVSTFGFSGLDNIDIDLKANYVSVDIGIQRHDPDADPANVIAEAILGSADFLEKTGDTRLAAIDFVALRQALQQLSATFRTEVGRSPSP